MKNWRRHRYHPEHGLIPLEDYCDHENVRDTVDPDGNIFRQCPDCGRAKFVKWADDAVDGETDDLPIFASGRQRWHEAYGTVDRRFPKDMHKQMYDAYLQSPEWASRRARVMERDDGTCQACLLASATDVHHKTYDHVFDEPLFDLVAVCRECHERITDMDRENRDRWERKETKWDDSYRGYRRHKKRRRY